MKIKKLIKSIKDFKEKNESCYCYVEGCGFYNACFVLPNLETKENIIFHNGTTDVEDFKIYETLTPKEFSKKILFITTYENFVNMIIVKYVDNVVFEKESIFRKDYKTSYASYSRITKKHLKD